VRKQPKARWSAEAIRARRALDEITNIDDVKQLRWLVSCLAQHLKKIESKKRLEE